MKSFKRKKKEKEVANGPSSNHPLFEGNLEEPSESISDSLPPPIERFKKGALLNVAAEGIALWKKLLVVAVLLVACVAGVVLGVLSFNDNESSSIGGEDTGEGDIAFTVSDFVVRVVFDDQIPGCGVSEVVLEDTGTGYVLKAFASTTEKGEWVGNFGQDQPNRFPNKISGFDTEGAAVCEKAVFINGALLTVVEAANFSHSWQVGSSSEDLDGLLDGAGEGETIMFPVNTGVNSSMSFNLSVKEGTNLGIVGQVDSDELLVLLTGNVQVSGSLSVSQVGLGSQNLTILINGSGSLHVENSSISMERCPTPMWQEIQGICYYFNFNELFLYSQAVQVCEREGGRLLQEGEQDVAEIISASSWTSEGECLLLDKAGTYIQLNEEECLTQVYQTVCTTKARNIVEFENDPGFTCDNQRRRRLQIVAGSGFNLIDSVVSATSYKDASTFFNSNAGLFGSTRGSFLVSPQYNLPFYELPFANLSFIPLQEEFVYIGISFEGNGSLAVGIDTIENMNFTVNATGDLIPFSRCVWPQYIHLHATDGAPCLTNINLTAGSESFMGLDMSTFADCYGFNTCDNDNAESENCILRYDSARECVVLDASTWTRDITLNLNSEACAAATTWRHPTMQQSIIYAEIDEATNRTIRLNTRYSNVEFSIGTKLAEIDNWSAIPTQFVLSGLTTQNMDQPVTRVRWLRIMAYDTVLYEYDATASGANDCINMCSPFASAEDGLLFGLDLLDEIWLEMDEVGCDKSPLTLISNAEAFLDPNVTYEPLFGEEVCEIARDFGSLYSHKDFDDYYLYAQYGATFAVVEIISEVFAEYRSLVVLWRNAVDNFDDYTSYDGCDIDIPTAVLQNRALEYVPDYDYLNSSEQTFICHILTETWRLSEGSKGSLL